MSMACSFSVPMTTGTSSLVSPTEIVALSLTVSSALWQRQRTICQFHTWRSAQTPALLRSYRKLTPSGRSQRGPPGSAPLEAPLVGLRHTQPALLLHERRVRPRHPHVAAEGQHHLQRGLRVVARAVRVG